MIPHVSPSLRLSSAVLSANLIAFSAPAVAQSENTDTAGNGNSLQLEEVIVTAQRKAQNLQDVAISMRVLSQDQIANANMSNSADIATYTPGLSTNNRFGSENASFAIRGFTKELRTTASVGVYFAEVTAPRGQNVQTSGDGAGPGTLFDLSNIQVLKGPQGTLFGRNTTGGAVLMVPNKPEDTFGGYLEYSGGDFGLSQYQTVLNVPLSDSFKLRLGVDHKEKDGYLNNVTGIGTDELNNVDYTAVRVSAMWDINDTMQNYLVVNYADSETFGNTSRLFDCTDDTPLENPLVAFTGLGCQQQLADQAANGNDGFYDVVSTVSKPITAIEDLRIINKFSWNFSENYTLNAIMAVTELYTENSSDVFGTQFTETQAAVLPFGFDISVADPNREFSPGVSLTNPNRPVTDQQGRVAELQIQGMAFEDKLDWQAGVYYEDSKPNGFSGNDSAILISCEIATIETGDPEQYNCFDPTGGQIGGVSNIRNKTEYENKAIYSQGTYHFNQTWALTTGLRYTWDDTEGEVLFAQHNFIGTIRQDPIVSDEQASQSSEAPTGLIELQYRPTETSMVYAKYVRGYRQGSVNMAADAGIQTHDEETVDTYEIGAKTSFDWFIPGRFNFALFQNELTDMQLQGGYVSTAKGPTTAIFNAGEAEIRGAEFDAFFQLTEGLSLSLSYSRLLTELLEAENNQAAVEAAGGPVAGSTFAPSAVEGDTLPFAADVSYTANINYVFDLPARAGRISLGATHAYVGEQRMSATGTTPFDVLDSFRITNLNASWMDIAGLPLDLTTFVTNIADEEYATYISGTDSSLGFSSRQMGTPKMYGARLRYHF